MEKDKKRTFQFFINTNKFINYTDHAQDNACSGPVILHCETSGKPNLFGYSLRSKATIQT